jgi:beta-lactamase superfamily II metal-dependent hydrolase
MAAITLDVLPADRGDCLWIECERAGRAPWLLLIDGGMPSSYAVLREHLSKLAKKGPVHIDLAVVSHIDSDHIGGLLPLFADPGIDVTFGDIWFNGLPQLPEPADVRPRSVAEGERLVDLLSGGTGGRKLPWNERFGRAAVMTKGESAFETVTFDDGPTLTLLSPTPRRLTSLRKTWTTELLKLQRGEPSEEEPTGVALPLDDLEKIAALDTRRDQTVANGSSIAFLLEHAGRRCLLAADAFASVLGSALTALANSRDGKPIDLDVFKLPHHASKGNVIAPLLDVVPADHYVISTNGERFHHPDDIALARVITRAKRPPTLWFNYAGNAVKRWSDPALRAKYRFSTRQPGKGEAGVRIELDARHP